MVEINFCFLATHLDWNLGFMGRGKVYRGVVRTLPSVAEHRTVIHMAVHLGGSADAGLLSVLAESIFSMIDPFVYPERFKFGFELWTSIVSVELTHGDPSGLPSWRPK